MRAIQFILATIMWLAILIMLLMLLTSPGWAHSEWITEQDRRSIDGIPCCNQHDCDLIHPKRVIETPTGYLVDRKIHIPFKHAQPGEDGYYHRCRYPDNRTRCFFTPGGGV